MSDDDKARLKVVEIAYGQAATRLRSIEYARPVPTPHQVCAELWLLEVRMPLADVIAACRGLNLPLGGMASDPSEQTVELPPNHR